MSTTAPTGLAGEPPAASGKVPITLHIGFFAMVIGMFMSILDVQIVASSIRQIQAGVSASSSEIAWVQTAYLIAEVVGIPLSGYLNRALGLRRLFIISAASFTGASILCALSWNLDSLIFFRVIQGFVGAAMVPSTMAAAFTLFPGGRSMTQQVMIGMVATLAPSIGPTLGGWITGHMSWHWLFLLNVIPGIAAVTLVWLFVPRQKGEAHLLRKIDLLGLASMAMMLGVFEWVVEEGPAEGWTQSSVIVRWSFYGLIAAMIFFYRAFKARNPIVDLTVFQDRNFASGAIVGSVVGFVLYGSVYALPLFLGQVQGYSALQIGAIMSVSGMAMFIGGPIAGALTRRFDPRLILGAGLILITIGVAGNAQMTHETGFNQLFWPQAIRGVGLILTMVPTTNLALGTLPPERVANASGLFTVCRNLGGAVGIAFLNTLLLRYTMLHEQDLGAGMSPARPEVQAWLAQAAARLQALGVADPEASAYMQLGMQVKMQALVMTYNNLFMAMAMSSAAAFFIVFFLRKPTPAAAPVAAH
ncbi:DHA2 family efflux MFS transporter permease subunit [Hyphomonas johnsonii]|uniref:Multidrug efflux system protein n=1 Tax=Hyphomonas johnsonii MHS-2 TaxID=1280950 RepID=A0A059FTH2_9PROT|nr:DHA2 family efflux MFS transporter permease subunit [Hyphomonas johnsonii]KCZ93907.1 multidrug efflux system protein [Hyphomonas johnsonii MHS-2]